jgi:hypothetical protein
VIYTPPLEEEVDSKTTVFEDGGVQNISRIKIKRTVIILISYCPHVVCKENMQGIVLRLLLQW